MFFFNIPDIYYIRQFVIRFEACVDFLRHPVATVSLAGKVSCSQTALRLYFLSVLSLSFFRRCKYLLLVLVELISFFVRMVYFNQILIIFKNIKTVRKKQFYSLQKYLEDSGLQVV